MKDFLGYLLFLLFVFGVYLLLLFFDKPQDNKIDSYSFYQGVSATSECWDEFVIGEDIDYLLMDLRDKNINMEEFRNELILIGLNDTSYVQCLYGLDDNKEYRNMWR